MLADYYTCATSLHGEANCKASLQLWMALPLSQVEPGVWHRPAWHVEAQNSSGSAPFAPVGEIIYEVHTQNRNWKSTDDVCFLTRGGSFLKIV